MVASNLWFSAPKPKPEAKLRLFCFPYAGGSASVYRSWASALPSHVELVTVQLPGRENRLKEQPEIVLENLLVPLKYEIKPFLNKPFMFFGHSMGGLISFELARQLSKENKNFLPQKIFISGSTAPHLRRDLEKISDLPTEDFLKKLEKLNGTPQDFFEHRELLDFFLPILRADFALCESYIFQDETPLSCPIFVYTGQDDDITLEDQLSWKRYTSSEFMLKAFSGDHFFIKSNEGNVIRNLCLDME